MIVANASDAAIVLKVTYKPGYSRWSNSRTYEYEFSTRAEADRFLEDYADSLESYEEVQDLPLSMTPGFDPETPGREYELRRTTYEINEGRSSES